MRKHVLLLLLLLSLFLTCCNIERDGTVTDSYSSNPFLDAKVIPAPAGDSLKFLLLSDEHIGRTNNGATHNLANLYAFMEAGGFPFAVSLGDLSDDGRRTQEVYDFISGVKGRTTENLFIQCVGNHDRHAESSSYADLLEEQHVSMCRYVCGNLSMYVLDNSMRTFTKQQFTWLEEALKADTSKYKMFFAHENICAGTNLSNTQVMAGFADVSEMNHLFSLMDKYKVGLILTGHTHSGNEVYDSPSGNYAEYNVCSFVKTTSIFEPGDMWYTLEVDMTNGKVVVRGYNGTSVEHVDTKAFILPS